MHDDEEMQKLKSRIAEVFARRERLKQALNDGSLQPRSGFPQLEATDSELSALDSRYKRLWDAAHPRVPYHPAAGWARAVVFEPLQLDCVTAIMLKILDAKCKMDEADKTALAALYDVVKDRPGQSLPVAIHGLIAAARRGPHPVLAAQIHDWRVQAEVRIPKPTMKAFKQFLRASMPVC